MSAEFVFVSFDNPAAAGNGAFKKRVRSQAATYSHRVAPRRGVKAAKYQPRPHNATVPTGSARASISDASTSGAPTASPKNSPVAAPAKRVKRGASRSGPAKASVSPSPLFNSLRQKSPVTSRQERRPSASPGPAPTTEGRKSPASALHRLHTTEGTTNQANIGRKRGRSRSLHREPNNAAMLIPFGALPDPSYMDCSVKDPFDTYPVSYQPWFGWLLDFWYTGTLPRSRRLVKTTVEHMDAYILWSRRFELTEPALFYTSLFLATGIPVANGMLAVEKALWLRGQAVRALNEALSDPARATSNAVISAVGKIALHEHIYGDRQAAHLIHRPAQQRMIAMRGGIETLKLPAITLQLMTWYDALMSAESGTPAYFADLPKKMALASYTNEEAVNVTNVSSPHRYRHPGYGTMQSPELSSARPAGRSEAQGMQSSCARP